MSYGPTNGEEFMVGFDIMSGFEDMSGFNNLSGFSGEGLERVGSAEKKVW